MVALTTREIAAAAAGAAVAVLLRTAIESAAAPKEHAPDAASGAEAPPLSCAAEDALVKPYNCDVCRLRWRHSGDRDAHLASKEHRRNLALIQGARPSGGLLSKASENLHCAYCNVWLRDRAAYGLHVAGKKHARIVQSAGKTASHEFFEALQAASDAQVAAGATAVADDDGTSASAAIDEAEADGAHPDQAIGVITCDLEKAENAGAIYRLLGNFSAVGAAVVHVHTPLGSGETQQHLLRSGAMRLAARNTDAKLVRRVLSLDRFVTGIRSWPKPIVVVETASGAADIHAFAFPERCDVLVGGETRGVHPSILAALRPGIDSTVYIPMQGFSKSMSEAEPPVRSRCACCPRASQRATCTILSVHRCGGRHLRHALRIPTATPKSLNHTLLPAARR